MNWVEIPNNQMNCRISRKDTKGNGEYHFIILNRSRFFRFSKIIRVFVKHSAGGWRHHVIVKDLIGRKIPKSLRGENLLNNNIIKHGEIARLTSKSWISGIETHKRTIGLNQSVTSPQNRQRSERNCRKL